ncbi:RloB family protein [Marinifilum sp. D737]|uniref:RloB family protein n=1 Tax=Marinifilum sp. D737 TaxID=2969628 RepID=UPI002273B80E|nr:RloB family protein [Marinifilum sp. D737]MCY1635771.1 RloB family protein [Marinifilum sp. D737]
MRKKRGYKREPELALLRDYKLFAIACEGGKREPEYFKTFRYISPRVAVDIIEDIVSDSEMTVVHDNKSAPKWVLDRAVKYIDKEGLSKEDELWFVMDKDRWSESQLREIAMYCEEYPNWHIVISNPCFEVWLYFHKNKEKPNPTISSCNNFKNALSTFTPGGYHPLKYIPDFMQAIDNARENDTSEEFFIPNLKETKVYELGQVLIEFIGVSAFNIFIENKLPKMIAAELKKWKTKQKKTH